MSICIICGGPNNRKAENTQCFDCAAKKDAAYAKRWSKERPLARAAITIVNKAIKAGKLPKLTGTIKCVDCGKPAAHYDHRDYRKPMQVEAVCTSCNRMRGPGSPYKRFKPKRGYDILNPNKAFREVAK